MSTENPDLFDWAASRPTGLVIDIVSLLMLRAWQDRTKPIAHRDGALIDMPPRPQPDKPTRRIA